MPKCKTPSKTKSMFAKKIGMIVAKGKMKGK